METKLAVAKLEADLCEITKGAISKFHRSLPSFITASILRLGDDSTRLLEIFTADAEGGRAGGAGSRAEMAGDR